ncbi:uncharacterized protein LOC113281972 [Papaver somniferum]|uniref:uncharacterized protein LOC113281972 n=1 Tax=Papaver somniferum TaxID=3469 RepID=UPI000E6F7863|nr:uncharacterized protein LOC113281972 [Papaver somniferum]
MLSSIPQPSMALCINNGGTAICNTTTTPTSQTHLSFRPQTIILNNPSKRSSHIATAKKISSRTGRFDSKNKKTTGGGGGGTSTTTIEEVDEVIERERSERDLADGVVTGIDDGYFLPELPGDKPDPFEGAQWDGLGFFLQYQWAFGVVFALIACGVAVATYNEGATDFKQTTVYKESVQSRELLEEPETSNADVFEGNPTEEAPSLE